MKKKLLAVVVVLGHVMSANAAPVRWAMESGGNDHWYDVIVGTTTWINANTLANQSSYLGVSGHLATITSAEENAFVNSLVDAFGAYELGGYQPNPAPSSSEGWAWVTGEEWNYTNWGRPEPNDAYGPNSEQYLELYNNGNTLGTWNDILGDFDRSGYIVEYSNIPIPATIWLFGSGLLGLIGVARRKKS